MTRLVSASLAMRMLLAADILEEVSAFIGSRNPEDMSWSAKECRHESGFVAAEYRTKAKCRACGEQVVCSDDGNVAFHNDGAGKGCGASGNPFHTHAELVA